MNLWNFECKDILKFPRSMIELNVVNLINYDITLKTSAIEDSGTTVPVFIQILGTNGRTPKKLLTDRGFRTGTLIQVSIETRDVGNVYGITLFLNGYDNWRPEEVIVKKPNTNGGSQDKIFKNNDNLALTQPDKGMTLKLPRPESVTDEDDTTTSNSSSLLDNKDQQSIYYYNIPRSNKAILY